MGLHTPTLGYGYGYGYGWQLRGRRSPRHCRGAAAMQAINIRRPLHGGMPQQQSAVVLQIWRQLHAQRVLDFRWLQQRSQQSRRREVGDRERIADEIGAALPLLLDPVERSVDRGAIGVQLRIADLVTKTVVRREDSPERS